MRSWGRRDFRRWLVFWYGVVRFGRVGGVVCGVSQVLRVGSCFVVWCWLGNISKRLGLVGGCS